MLRSGVAALVLIHAASGALAAQEIVGQPFWGFDGTVVPNRFNLLTVRVRNDTNKPIEKHLQLVKSASGLQRGAPIIQKCYLGPGARRFVQFHPFVVSTGDVWSLSWVEGGAAGATVLQPRASMPATILLEEEPVQASRRLRVPTFSPRLLPASATAMGTLRAVVLDQDPELTQPQRLALLDWLRRGGEIHLLLRGTGHPVLKDELEVLNSEQYVVAYGSGRVFRQEFDRFAMRKEVPVEIFGGPTPRILAYPGGAPVARLLRSQLREDIELEFGWGLIFALAVVYLALIGPLLYRLSTNRLSWPLSLLALAVIIGVATWSFALVGARGSGEMASTNSWTYARPAGEERYEVTRYANLFVTVGGDYEFGGSGEFGLFSSAQSAERINGRIRNGSKASYTVDMPRFSTRFVVHKDTVPGPKADFAYDGRRLKLELDVEEVVSVNGRLLHWWSSDGPGYYRPTGDVLRLADLLLQRGANRVELLDTVIERMHLKNWDLQKPATRRNHHVFFCIGPTPDEFLLQGRGPGVDLGQHRQRVTVYRFDALLGNQ